MASLFGGFEVPTSVNGGIANAANLLGVAAVGTIQSEAGALTQKLQGKLFGALGAKLGSAIQTTSADSWYAKAASRADPHLHIDWDIEMPNGFPSQYVESVSAPILEYGSGGGIFRGGQFIYMPESGDVGTLSLVFYEDNQFTSSKFLSSWRNRISLNGVYAYPATYKKVIRVKALDVSGALVCTLDYYGCWPQKSQNGYTLGSDSSERTTLTVEFAVDYMAITFPSSISSSDPFGFSNVASFLRGAPANILNSVASGVGGMLTSSIAGALNF